MLKDETYYMSKFHEMAAKFGDLHRNKEYGRAAQVYRNAFAAAMFLELPREKLSELFGGYWDDDETDAPAPKGLFPYDIVREVNWECCIYQHKTYQDEALRRSRFKTEFYSDPGYCAKNCRGAAALPWK